MVQRAIDIVASALTTVLLAFGLFGSGLVVCMMPQTTQLLGNNFSGWNEATYPQDTMRDLAEAVRSFSIDDTGRPQLEACVRTALEEHFPDIERTLAAGNTGRKHGREPLRWRHRRRQPALNLHPTRKRGGSSGRLHPRVRYLAHHDHLEPGLRCRRDHPAHRA